MLERRRDATTTDNRFVRSFVILFPSSFMELLSSLSDSLDQLGFVHRSKVHAAASEREHWHTSHSTLNSHHGPHPIMT